MPSVDTVRAQVESFLQQHETGTLRREDAFAPWFLVQEFKLPPQEAIAQSASGNYDGGIDAFHIERRPDVPPLLNIVQAKFSDQEAVVRKGIDDLRRALDVVWQLLAVGPTEMADEDRVVRGLRRNLLVLSESERSALEVKCILIHLLKDQEFWLSKPPVQRSKQEFQRAVEDGRFAGRVTLTFRAPAQMLDGDAIPRPATPIPIRFQGVSLDGAGLDGALFGLGHLSDLVNLHEKYRADLFGKNVRMYLARQATKPKSAASHIRLSLERICDGKMPAAYFAMTHNGVTLSVPRVTGPHEGHVVLEPAQAGVYVLNGCQTVYTAWKFFKQRSDKQPNGSWLAEWDAIRLPVRIIVTNDDERVRTVTIGANRQTEIRPSAFWAHDAIQLHLERCFERKRIFYERQEGAWDEISRSDPAKADDFSSGKLNMEDLARAIAAADRSLSLEFAKSPNRIFDDESAYRKVFKEKNLASVRLLLFLVNTIEATRFVLKDLTNDVARLGGLTPSRFVFPIFRLLVHWIAKKNREFIGEFGDSVVGTSPNSEIRKRVRQWFNYNHSGIQQLLPEIWWDPEEGCWADALDRERLVRTFQKLKLDSTFLFEGWDEFDEQSDDAG